MSRVINTNSPGKIRSQNRRLIAELLRHLSKKSDVDTEAQDMLAAIVYALNEIHDSVTTTAVAWEKRDYWIKAERFSNEWRWVPQLAANLDDVLREQAWDLMPRLIGDLFPRFADINVKSFTRKPIEWRGAYQRLMSEPRPDMPW